MRWWARPPYTRHYALVIEDELVAAFWRFHALRRSDQRDERLRADDVFWASDAVQVAMEGGGSGAIELLVALSEAAPDGQALVYLGCGPIEDLMSSHGNDDVDLLDEAARMNAKLRVALGWAVPPTGMSEENIARLERYRRAP